MSTFTVKAVKELASGTSEKTGDPWTRQKVRLVNGNGEITDVQLFCGKFVKVPSEGDTLEGEVEPAKKEGWLPELKLARKGGGGGFGGPRPEDPKRMASIAMQHSQDTALRMVTWALENAQLKPPEGEDAYNWFALQVRAEADRLYQQVKGAQDA